LVFIPDLDFLALIADLDLILILVLIANLDLVLIPGLDCFDLDSWSWLLFLIYDLASTVYVLTLILNPSSKPSAS